MHRNEGWWYDRRRGVSKVIQDHAVAVVTDPRRYRLGIDYLLDPVRDRERVIKAAARQGFIRIRYTNGRLGWQFWGDPAGAYAALRRFIRRHEVGDYEVVTFTELARRRPVTVQNDARLFIRFLRNRELLPKLDAMIERWDRRDVRIR